jgi:hypothetical protein
MLRNAVAALIVLSGASAAHAQHAGPVHALELGDRLGLDAAQRAKVGELVAAMTAEAIPLGERLIAQEADLDRLFAGKRVTPANLQAAHLRYHLATLDVLTPHQVHRYRELRGDTGGHGGAGSRP